MASTTAAATDGNIFRARRWHELYHAAIIELDRTQNFRAGLLKLASKRFCDRRKNFDHISRMNATLTTR